jgi:hypothetical protein
MRRRDLFYFAPALALAETGGTGWVKSPRNPMLSLGGKGDFDYQNIMSPCIVKEGGRYFLFYSGGPEGPATNGEFVRYQLGLALSDDGEAWKKTGRPLLPLGPDMNFHTTPTLLRNPDGTLLKQSGLWHMLFCANRNDDIAHATSPDGVRWTLDDRGPVFRRGYAPTVVHTGAEIRMYYIHKPTPKGSDNPRPWEVHLATGNDLFSLKPHAANPLLMVSQPWEKKALFYPWVIQEGSTWVMFYASYWNKKDAGKTDYTAIGMATSDDGIRWKKLPNNPILTPIPGSSYESVYNSSQSVIRDGGGYRLYYAARIDMKHKYYAICMARKKGSLLE